MDSNSLLIVLFSIFASDILPVFLIAGAGFLFAHSSSTLPPHLWQAQFFFQRFSVRWRWHHCSPISD